MNRHIFIAGTDTDVGKTVVTNGLLRVLNRGSRRAVGMKPVAAGARQTANGLRNDDALALAANSAVELPYETLNPYVFPDPVSPDIAAARCGAAVDLELIETAFEHCCAAAEIVVVEGIGGWRVPLGKHLQTRDLVLRLKLPVILVCGIRLGCINHSLLSAESVVGDGLELAGWIANSIDPDYAYVEETVGSMRQRMPAPLLGEIAWRTPFEPAMIDAALKPCCNRLWPL